MEWIFQGKPLEECRIDIADYTGFVYRITNIETGKFYIGKKLFHSTRKQKLTKAELAAYAGKAGRKPTHKQVIKESDWRKYYSSCAALKEDITALGKHCFVREVLVLCKTKKQLTYWEVHLQCLYNCLLGAACYNDNINGTYYYGDMLVDVVGSF
jgi:hypothetical protein